MNITTAQYILGRDGNNDNVKATIDGEEIFVPLDPNNRHYAAILVCKQKTANEIQAAD